MMKSNFIKYSLALSTIFLGSSCVPSFGQWGFNWIQPDIPYVEDRGFGLGCTLGMTDLWSDVGTKNPINHYVNDLYWKNTHYMGNLFVRYNHFPGLAFRLGIGYGQVYADDKWNRNTAIETPKDMDDAYQRYLRNLNVRSNIWELSFLTEIAPMRLFSNWELGRGSTRRFQPYLLLGASAVRFNPKGLYKDFETGNKYWLDLRELRTEGQGYNLPGMPETYSKYTWAATGGLGVKWDVGRAFGLGLEWNLRYVFTDYLDDASGKYIDPIYHEIANVNDPEKALVVNRMMDKSYEIIPGYRNPAGYMRADPNNKDMYSTINLMFYWKIDKRQLLWWNTYR